MDGKKEGYEITQFFIDSAVYIRIGTSSLTKKTTFREGFAKIKSDLGKKQSAYKDRLERSYGVIRQNYGERLKNQKS